MTETATAIEQPRPGWWRRTRTMLRLWNSVADSQVFGAVGILRLVPFVRRYAAAPQRWSYTRHPVPPRAFGSGAPKSFRWCFESETQVAARSVNEICEWLCGCRYAFDDDTFVTPDFWQHPRTFEMIRRGDCEDHALWAWRKLREIGFPAWLVVGSTAWYPERPPHRHVWVQFTRGEGEEVVLEATCKQASAMIRPVDTVRDVYRPHFAVEHGTFHTRVYGGFLEDLRMYHPSRQSQPPGHTTGG